MGKTRRRKRSDETAELDMLAKMSFQDFWDRWGQTLRILSPYEIAWASWRNAYHDGHLDGLTVAGAVDVTANEPRARK